MRSDIVKKGATRCAHRSLFHANGYDEDDLKKPLIGICNSFNEIIPGHMHLREIAEAAKLGVAAAGGTPMEFPAIGVCDGIAELPPAERQERRAPALGQGEGLYRARLYGHLPRDHRHLVPAEL